MILTGKKKTNKLSSSPSTARKNTGKSKSDTTTTTTSEIIENAQEPTNDLPTNSQPQLPSMSIEDDESDHEPNEKVAENSAEGTDESKEAGNDTSGVNSSAEDNKPSTEPSTPSTLADQKVASYEKMQPKVATAHQKIDKKEVREIDTSSKVARMLLRKRSSISVNDAQQVQKLNREHSTSDGLTLEPEHSEPPSQSISTTPPVAAVVTTNENDNRGNILQDDEEIAPKRNSAEASSSKGNERSEANLFSVRVIKTECLKVDMHISHPVVLVHVVDKKTGEYVKKSDPNRPGVTHCENVTMAEGKSENCDFLLPIMTAPFTLKKFPAQKQTSGSSLAPPQSSQPSSSSPTPLASPHPTADPSGATVPLSPRVQQAQIAANTSDPKKNPLYCPNWDEELLWNEAHDYLCSGSLGTVLLFEVLDFGPRLPLELTVGGWLPVAWAFLVPNNHTGKSVRLQLFEYPHMKYPSIDIYQQLPNDNLKIPRVFNVFSTQAHSRYPSTLYVSVNHFLPPPPNSTVPVLRPSSIFEPQLISRQYAPSDRKSTQMSVEQGGDSIEKKPEDGVEDKDGAGANTSSGATTGKPNGKKMSDAMEKMDVGLRRALRVRRNPKQQCFIPDSVLMRLDSSARGCFGLEFSHKGQFLAASCADLAMFPIKIYDIYESKCVHTYPGHHDLVYDITWCPTDDALLTASSDGTAKIWPFPAKSNVPGVVTLQHTCYVYAAQFFPNPSIRIVATGAYLIEKANENSEIYDNTVRLWDRDNGKMLVEASPHKSHVNAIKFDAKGERLYSGDGAGSVAIWSCYESGNDESPIILQCLKVVSLFGSAPINSIQIHPSGRRILIHSRNSTIHSLDSRFLTPISSFTGLVNIDWPIKSAYSPCGTYVATGSENSKIMIYTEETGILAHNYMGGTLGFTEPATSVAWHPSHHIMALCTFGPRAPILVLAKKNPERMKDENMTASPSIEKGNRTKSMQASLIANKLELPPVFSQPDMRKVSALSLPPLMGPPSAPPPDFPTSPSIPIFAMECGKEKSIKKEITLGELDIRKGRVGNGMVDRNKNEGLKSSIGWSEVVGDGTRTSSVMSNAALRRSAVLTTPSPPSEEEARRNRKKHRKARREATLTQLRKDRDVENDEDEDEEDDNRESLVLPPIASFGRSPPKAHIKNSGLQTASSYNIKNVGNSLQPASSYNKKQQQQFKGEDKYFSYKHRPTLANSNNYNDDLIDVPTNKPKPMHTHQDAEDDDNVIVTHHPFGT